jgi:alkylation response protein AidB-like acyl-CoA dehydrogenase
MWTNLTSEQQRWLEIANGVAAKIKAADRSFDQAARFTDENMALLRDAGLLKLAVPKAYDGEAPESGNAHFGCYIVTEAIARACSTTGWNLIIHYHQCGAVARLGNDEQKRRILGDVVRNGVLMGSLGSEINHQESVASKDTKTRLFFNAGMEPVDGGFFANASKHFCSNGPVAKYLLYWSIAPGAESSRDGLTLSIVEAGSAGLTFNENGWDNIIGLRGTVSWSATLENVFIPWKNVLGEPADFITKDPYTLELSQAFHLIGAARGAFDCVLDTMRKRPFLRKEDGLMVEVGHMAASIQAAAGSAMLAARLWEAKTWGDAALASLSAHHTARETALAVATKAFDIIGTRALLNSMPLEMFWRDIRAASLHTRDSQLIRLVADATVDGQYAPKQKYGDIGKTLTWAELGLGPEVTAKAG